jgi:hypothetical protein
MLPGGISTNLQAAHVLCLGARKMRRSLILITAGAIFVLVAAAIAAEEFGMWNVGGSLKTPRGSHAAAFLPGGKALIVGGADSSGQPLNSAEIYDLATNVFSPLTATLPAAVSNPTATSLKDGTVLIAGGTDSSGMPVAAAELYHPDTGTISAVPGGMTAARAKHTATLLADGRVLIAGGTDGSNALATLEIFDPSTGQFARRLHNWRRRGWIIPLRCWQTGGC